MRVLCLSFAAAVWVGAAFQPRALAQLNPPSPPATQADDKEAARSLAERGFELFEQGDAEKAIQSFMMAERRFHSPVHQLYIARAQVKLGKLVEAIQTYETILTEKLTDSSPKPFLDARLDAAKEAEALKGRTPAIKIILSGQSAQKAEIRLDGVLLSASQIGTPVRANPGNHTVVASISGIGEIRRPIQLNDAAYVQSVEIQVESSSVSIPMVTAFSLGGVGLVVGTATGVAYLGKETPNKALGAVSLAGLITGGIGLIAGTGLLISSSNNEVVDGRSRPSIYARIGPASFHLGGTF